ncbi:MAG TPA: NAD(P)-dependent alcohol dehydrogenase, partial [Thermoanaerobaculia bacterium]|nr:NAD(P)-dependent alcohol dehydrogenase [Thermoanaerobaculia bacterium]
MTQGDGIDALRTVDLPVPSAGPREVLVRMTAAALNFRDLLVVKGQGGWKPPEDRVPVSDGVGVVTA